MRHLFEGKIVKIDLPSSMLYFALKKDNRILCLIRTVLNGIYDLFGQI